MDQTARGIIPEYRIVPGDFVVAEHAQRGRMGWARAVADAGLMSVIASETFAFLSFYQASTALRIVAVGFGVISFGFTMISSTNVSLRTMSLLVFALSLPFAAISGPSSSLKSLLVPFSFLSAIGCAWYALEFRRTWVLWEVPFFAYLTLTIFLVLVKSYGPVEFDSFFAGIGRNGYSAILVALTSGFLISRSVRDLNPPLVPLALAFACSIPLYGRSSIAAIAFLFVMSATQRWPRAFPVATAIVALVSLASALRVDEFVLVNTNFKSGVDSLRWVFLTDYLARIDAKTLFLGVSFLDIPSIQANDGSPDSAFLRLHSFLGVMFFVYMSQFLASAFRLATQRRLVLLGVLAAIAVRASTDVIIVFGTIDLFFIAILFYPYFERYWPVRVSETNDFQRLRVLESSGIQ